MRFTKSLALVLLTALCAALPALAQVLPVLTFTAQTVTGNGSVTPIFTWSTQPAATSCTASGSSAWAGAKAAAGTQTLAPITSSKTYNLTCDWPGDTSARLTWVAPTMNTNNTPYTDPGGYKIYYGTAAASLNQPPITISNPATLSHTITALAAGQWFFAMTAFNLLNVESARTNTVSKTIAIATSVQRSVGITVNPMPLPPANIVIN
jgi:hypothetical protein